MVRLQHAMGDILVRLPFTPTGMALKAGLGPDDIPDSVSLLSVTFVTLQPLSVALGRRVGFKVSVHQECALHSPLITPCCSPPSILARLFVLGSKVSLSL